MKEPQEGERGRTRKEGGDSDANVRHHGWGLPWTFISGGNARKIKRTQSNLQNGGWGDRWGNSLQGKSRKPDFKGGGQNRGVTLLGSLVRDVVEKKPSKVKGSGGAF